MNLLNLKSWLGLLLCLSIVPTIASGQDSNNGSLTVPTPSFSNPGSRAETTEVPATGTTLKKLNPIRLPGAESIIKETIDEENIETPDNQKNEDSESPSSSSKPREPRKKKPNWSKTEESRMVMLERIGDQLSLRMRALKEREEALAQREKALIEREQKAAERETVIREIEESLLSREAIVRRREKLPPPQVWRGNSAPSVYAKYATVLDGRTMQFYHAKNSTSPTPVASTQKLLTALVVCEKGSLDEYVVVPRAATLVEPTKVGIKTGERYTRRQLLTSLLVKSGNDIAAALAIDNAGSPEAFAEKMNLYGKRIGLVNSNFKTPHGLPARGQYSCARDIGIVAFEAYQNPEIREIVKTKHFRFHFPGDRGSILFSNTNRLLREWEDCNGMKTGFTYAAGRCLVSSAYRDGQHRIAVVIKTSNDGVWRDSRKLLEWSFGLEMLGPMKADEWAVVGG